MFTPDKSLFKNTGGVYITQGLFLESPFQTTSAQYTLKDEDFTKDGKTYPSLKRLFLEEPDVTEYTFAMKYLFSWAHWQKLSTSSFFSEHIKSWREERDVRERSQLLAVIQKEAMSGKNAYGAAKTLLEKNWDKSAGRPSNDKIKREAEKLVEQNSKFDDDYERLLNETDGTSG